MQLIGKKALVTGGASGIGEAIVRRFAKEGAQIMLADINISAAQDVTDDLLKIYPEIHCIKTDVTKDQDINNMIKETVSKLGSVDILINNAGIPMVGTVETLSDNDWNIELDVNLKSIYRTSKAIWPYFKAQKGGVILNTASVAGLVGMAGQHSYSTAKAGVVMLTRCMALDGAPENIRVNCICPGFVKTPMADSFLQSQKNPEETKAFIESLHPIGRIGRPEDIASGFVYLASEDASWITGIALPIDGGWSAGSIN
ncbi:MAG: hypothetical protein CMM30_05420 [Rhodospirillaceae bacterium]|nr:hypothetical protein [Rhodospirillaceae bacterium]|tara:strand:- start:1931 stop:2701 length:771 start_codon:yes stop_codon:yes gene_type:complete